MLLLRLTDMNVESRWSLICQTFNEPLLCTKTSVLLWLRRHGFQGVGEKAQGRSSKVPAVQRMNAGQVQRRGKFYEPTWAEVGLWKERGLSSPLGDG